MHSTQISIESRKACLENREKCIPEARGVLNGQDVILENDHNASSPKCNSMRSHYCAIRRFDAGKNDMHIPNFEQHFESRDIVFQLLLVLYYLNGKLHHVLTKNRTGCISL